MSWLERPSGVEPVAVNDWISVTIVATSVPTGAIIIAPELSSLKAKREYLIPATDWTRLMMAFFAVSIFGAPPTSSFILPELSIRMTTFG